MLLTPASQPCAHLQESLAHSSQIVPHSPQTLLNRFKVFTDSLQLFQRHDTSFTPALHQHQARARVRRPVHPLQAPLLIHLVATPCNNKQRSMDSVVPTPTATLARDKLLACTNLEHITKQTSMYFSTVTGCHLQSLIPTLMAAQPEGTPTKQHSTLKKPPLWHPVQRSRSTPDQIVQVVLDRSTCTKQSPMRTLQLW